MTYKFYFFIKSKNIGVIRVKKELIVFSILLILATAPIFNATKIQSIGINNKNEKKDLPVGTTLIRTEIEITRDTTSQTFTGTVSQGYDSQRHAFTVDSSVTRIEVYLYMPSGTDFDLSVWDPNGYRTGGLD